MDMEKVHLEYQTEMQKLQRFYRNEMEHTDRIAYYLDQKIEAIKRDINKSKNSSKTSSKNQSPEQYRSSYHENDENDYNQYNQSQRQVNHSKKISFDLDQNHGHGSQKNMSFNN